VARAEQSGPVFSVVDGGLHMRYTARTRSIAWHTDADVAAARRALAALLDGEPEWALRVRLDAGCGLIGHNVLHDRSAFTDHAGRPRLLYRARYLDRAAPPGTAPGGA
jgi:hypothetical protein